MSDLPPPSAPRHGHPLDPSRRQLLQAILALPFATAVARAAAPAVGKPAPRFRLQDQTGRWITLDAQRGKWVVLYFYPKDDTPGCTKEACAFRDNFPKFRKLGVEVLGVSTDGEKAHQKFIAKYELPFRLLADDDKKIVEAFGVWGEKSLYGRKYMGTNRVTYLIDEAGKIAAVWPKVKPETHAAEILAKLNEG